MSGKVLPTISRALTPDAIDAMADAAKMDRASARKAAELGVPAILTSLTGLVVKASGIARLTRALAGQSTSSGPAQDDHGHGLSFLLGDADARALASTIGRVVGAPEGSAYAFLDELTSTMLRTLAGASERVHGGGKAVANLLAAERDLIAAAMPAGLSKLLSARVTSGPLATVLGAKANERHERAAASAPMRRAYWAVVLAALAAVASYVLAASINQAGGAGSDAAIAILPEANASPQAQADVAAFDRFNPAGQSKGSVRHVLDGADKIALALVSLARRLGLGEAGSAAPAAHLRRGQRGADGHLLLDGGEGRAPQRLHFAPPEFRDAIRPPLTTAADRSAGRTIVSH